MQHTTQQKATEKGCHKSSTYPHDILPSYMVIAADVIVLRLVVQQGFLVKLSAAGLDGILRCRKLPATDVNHLLWHGTKPLQSHDLVDQGPWGAVASSAAQTSYVTCCMLRRW